MTTKQSLLKRSAPSRRQPKIRLLLAVPWFDVGGSSALLREVFKIVAKRNVDIVSLATNPISDPILNAGQSWYQSFSKKLYSAQNISGFEESQKFLTEICQKENIDAIMLVGSQMTYDCLPHLKAQFPRLKVIDHLYNPVGHVASNQRYRSFIDFNIAASEEVEKKLLEMGEVLSRIRLIGHGIDVSKFDPKQASYVQRRKKRKDRRLTFGFLGRFSWEKRPDDFLDLARAFPKARFIMAGFGPLESEVREKIRQEGLRNVEFLGFVKSPMDFYAQADVFVLTSEVEGLPITLLESMALKKIVIVTRVGFIDRVVESGKNGFLYEPKDVPQLIRWTQKVMRMPPARRRTLGQRARTQILAEHSSKQCAQNYLATFHQVVNRS